MMTELDGIVNQVIKHLLDLSQIRIHHLHAVRKGQFEINILLFTGSLKGSRCVFDHAVDIKA